MYDYVNGDDPRSVRLAHRLSKFTQSGRNRALLFAVAMVLLVVFGYMLFVSIHWLTYWVIDGDDFAGVERSAHYTMPANDARHFEWLDQHSLVADLRQKRVKSPMPNSTVAWSVVESRARFRNAKPIVLLDENYCDVRKSRSLQCREIASLGTCRDNCDAEKEFQQDFLLMQMQAHRFLVGSRHTKLCTCGPMLGRAISYLAVYTNKLDEGLPPNATDAQIFADSSRSVTHFFNVDDVQMEAYDNLDAEMLKNSGIGLQIAAENQDYRYNASRGTFVLIRRTSVRVAYKDAQCISRAARFDGAIALCAQECLDLMRGIDVRERARMQFRQSVALNAVYFNKTKADAPFCKTEVETETEAETEMPPSSPRGREDL